MKYLFCALIVLIGVSLSPVMATDQQIVKHLITWSTGSVQIDYVVPAGSPVKYVRVANKYVGTTIEDGSAKFSGRFVLSGTYHYGYYSDTSEVTDSDNTLELYFVPDRSIGIRLPYWVKRTPPEEIRFANADEFIDAVIPAEIKESLKSKQQYSVSGRAAVWVSNYTADVECDAPHYYVKFDKLASKPSMRLAKSPLNIVGC